MPVGPLIKSPVPDKFILPDKYKLLNGISDDPREYVGTFGTILPVNPNNSPINTGAVCLTGLKFVINIGSVEASLFDII